MTRRKRHKKKGTESVRTPLRFHGWLLAAVAIVMLSPLLYYGVPINLATPDILYVKAKVLQVMAGRLFADPVSGYDTLHPFLYYLAMVPLRVIGLSMNTILLLITIVNVAGVFFFAYRVIRTAFDRQTAFFTCLMIPFISEFMGYRLTLLATSFSFSVPIYLAGLWLYLKPEPSRRRDIWTAVLWGLAFLISPVYVFLLALTFVYEGPVKRCWKRMLTLGVVFGITIVPFFIQALTVYIQDLWGSRVFAFWRGIPDGDWLAGFVVGFLSPIKLKLLSIPSAIHALILVTAGIVIVRGRSIHPFIPLSLLAYVMTYYHFSASYALRIQQIFSLLAVAAAIHGLQHFRVRRAIWTTIVLMFAAGSVAWHSYANVSDYKVERDEYDHYRRAGRMFWANMETYFEPDEYIFCQKTIYLQYVMPYMRMRALSAYRTLDYFQLKAELADSMEADYQRAMGSNDYAEIDSIAARYGIRTALVATRDASVPLFQTLKQHWESVYQDGFFTILKKPEG